MTDTFPKPHQNRTAVITGGARGMGFECARLLGHLGASVALLDRDADAVVSAQERLAGEGIPAGGYPLDVTDDDAVGHVVDAVVSDLGPPTILVNAAGILRPTRILDISFSEWRSVVGVSLDGTFLVSRACLPSMIDAEWGRIVNFSSTAGKSVSTLGGAHYTAAKAGVLGLTRAIAKEVAPYGVCVNAVCPGLIRTEMVVATQTDDELERFVAGFPIRRLGEASEVAALVAYLVSADAAYITGAAFDINGGDLMV